MMQDHVFKSGCEKPAAGHAGGRNTASRLPSAVILFILSLFFLLLISPMVHAGEILIEPGGDRLSEALAAAHSGDTIRLLPGVHNGPIVIDKSIKLVGKRGVEIVGPGEGSVIRVTAPDTTVTGITVKGSGIDLFEQDAGIFVEKTAHRAHIVGNTLSGNLIGIYLHGPENAVVRDNDITGRNDLRLNERGNGIQLWNTPGSLVEGNRIRSGRDGVFVTTSRNNTFRDNEFHDLRFAVHYMYTNDSRIEGNRSYGNHVGYAIMYSRGIKVYRNLSEGDRDHGIMLNYANKSEFTGNVVHEGGEKCVFIYNANRNEFRRNWFEGCEIGVHFTAGSERNIINRNAFVDSRTQVKYVGTRALDWAENGAGNYWSDHPGFDLNSDGIADKTYHPNDLVDQVVWRRPTAKLLLNAPAVQILRWAQRQLPALLPGGVRDSAPLMRPPAIDLADIVKANPVKSEADTPARKEVVQ